MCYDLRGFPIPSICTNSKGLLGARGIPNACLEHKALSTQLHERYVNPATSQVIRRLDDTYQKLLIYCIFDQNITG